MRFGIVTPVRNGEHLVADTVRSIVSQEGVSEGIIEIDYVIQDGASTDDTAAVAEAAAGGLARVVSRADEGMYDALAQGLRQVDGDVFFYLNAGDMLQPRALLRLAEIFSRDDIDWVCGLHLFYSATGEIVSARLPFRFRRRFVARGYYGRGLPNIQQESTFWSRAAMHTVDLGQLAKFRLAGDYFLWHSINDRFELNIAQVALSGFRYHGDHLGSAASAYAAEVRRVAGPLGVVDRILMAPEKVRWKLPDRIRRNSHPPLLAYSAADSTWTRL